MKKTLPHSSLKSIFISFSHAEWQIAIALIPTLDRIAQLRDILNAGTPPAEDDAKDVLKLPNSELASNTRQRRLDLSVAGEVLSEHNESVEVLIAAGATLGEGIVKLQKALRAADDERNMPMSPDIPRL